MSKGFTKLFSDIVTSTIWQEPNDCRVLWITMLALKGEDNICRATVPALAKLSNITNEECEAYLRKFQAPDKYSRSRDFEGRRIEEVDGGWLILNGEKYRQMWRGEDRREYFRVKKAESRARKNVSLTVHNSPQKSPIEEAEAKYTPEIPPSGSASPNGGDSPDGDGPGSIPEFKTPDLREAWRSWLAYRRSIGRPLTFPSRVELARKLDALHPAVASETIRNAIANGYIGLTPPKASPPPAPVVEDPEPRPEFTGGRDPREILRERKAAKAKS